MIVAGGERPASVDTVVLAEEVGADGEEFVVGCEGVGEAVGVADAEGESHGRSRWDGTDEAQAGSAPVGPTMPRPRRASSRKSLRCAGRRVCLLVDGERAAALVSSTMAGGRIGGFVRIESTIHDENSSFRLWSFLAGGEGGGGGQDEPLPSF